MKTIEQHNAEIAKRYEDAKERELHTGVQCPNCKPEVVELLKVDPHTLLASYPPQMAVYCPRCNYRTNILT